MDRNEIKEFTEWTFLSSFRFFSEYYHWNIEFIMHGGKSKQERRSISTFQYFFLAPMAKGRVPYCQKAEETYPKFLICILHTGIWRWICPHGISTFQADLLCSSIFCKLLKVQERGTIAHYMSNYDWGPFMLVTHHFRRRDNKRFHSINDVACVWG